MGRGRAFSPLEEQIIRENYDKTIAELEELLAQHGYARSRKSINRKLEKLREEGEIGFRSKDTIRRSYKQRNRRNKAGPTRLDDDGWDDTGSGGFDTSTGWDDVE